MFKTHRIEERADAAQLDYSIPAAETNPVKSSPADATEKIVILGGGITGLTVAWELSKYAKLPILLIEKSAATGGLAGSFSQQNLTFDFGSHRIHEQYDAEVLSIIKSLIGDDLLRRPRSGQIRIQNKFLDYPPSIFQMLTCFGVAEGVRLAGDYLLARGSINLLSSRRARRRLENSFEAYTTQAVGRSLYGKFYKPYALKLWGMHPTKLSFEPAMSRIKKFEMRAIWNEVKKKILKGATAHSFYYPAKGFGQIAEKLQERFLENGGEIIFESMIDRLELEKDRKIKAVRVRTSKGTTRHIPTRLLISTAPIDVMHELVRFEADEAEAPNLNLSWRSLRILYLLTPDKIPSSHETYYFPEPDVIFSRVSEPSKYSPFLNPNNKISALAVELPCTYGDDIWHMPDDLLAERCINDLRKVKILSDGLSGEPEYFSRRIKNLYPVYEVGWKENFQKAIERFSSIENLYLIGRPALFLHCNVDHCMSMALKLARFLSSENGQRKDWDRSQSEFYNLPLHD